MVRVLAGIANSSEADGARVAAAQHLLDRGWGKCDQPHTAEISGGLNITIRQIVAEKLKSKAKSGDDDG